MKIYITIMDKLNLLLKFLLGAFTIVALIVLTWQVLARFVFNSPLAWSDELVRYLLVWITFIGAGLAARYSKLIRLDFLFNMVKFPRKVEIGLRSLSNILTIAFCIIILMYSWELLEIVHVQKSPSMKIPMSIPYLSIPLGSIIMLLNVIVVWFEGENKNDGEGVI